MVQRKDIINHPALGRGEGNAPFINDYVGATDKLACGIVR